MKLVFLQDVPNLARVGEVKEVADGYGRNYLIPKKLAVLATPAEMKKVEALRQAQTVRQTRTDAEAMALAERLEDTPIVLKAKVGAKDRLYGSITASDIAAEVERTTGHEVDKRKLELEEPFRELGTYQVPLRLTPKVTAKIRVVIEEEKP